MIGMINKKNHTRWRQIERIERKTKPIMSFKKIMIILEGINKKIEEVEKMNLKYWDSEYKKLLPIARKFYYYNNENNFVFPMETWQDEDGEDYIYEASEISNYFRNWDYEYNKYHDQKNHKKKLRN